jgi:chloramphenicol-sensitive protein RarD
MSRLGFWSAFSAYCIWGLFPLYWKQLHDFPALAVAAHRLTWCFVWVAGFMTLLQGLRWLEPIRQHPKTLLWLLASACLIGLNWFLYIWAVSHGQVVASSLGYFLTPIVNIGMGVWLLKEKLKPSQWVSVGLTLLGVTTLTVHAGHLPWIALALAFSFGFYGFIRKKVAVEATTGLAVESGLLLPLALLYFATLAPAPSTPATWGWLVGGGLLTAIPLVLFATGARLLPLSTIGLLQFVGPTLQFLIGVFVYHEPFSGLQVLGFVLIWSALLVYVTDSLWRR